MSYTREQWSRAFLAAIGNPSPSQVVVDYVIAWTQFETAGPPQAFAAFNLLNTTEPNTPGVVSNFNTVGVKNYDTFEHGIQANAKVIQNGRYPDLFASLKANKMPSGDIAHELQVWGTGSASGILGLSGEPAHLKGNQVFSGAGPAGPPQPPPAPNPDPDTPAVKSIEDAFNKIVSDIQALKKQVEQLVEPGQP